VHARTSPSHETSARGLWRTRPQCIGAILIPSFNFGFTLDAGPKFDVGLGERTPFGVIVE
jgi:hypothetical protein